MVRRGRRKASTRAPSRWYLRVLYGVAPAMAAAVVLASMALHEVGGDWVESVYCGVMTLTTVGFGDVCPASRWTRCGGVVAVVLGGGFFGGPVARRAHAWSGLDDARVARNALCALGVGAVGFAALEGWEFGEALWFCVVLSTTVGYGDVAPVTPAGRLFCAAYAVCTLKVASDALGDVAMHRVFKGRERTAACVGILATAAVFRRVDAAASWVDATHCAVATLTTVGYGDICPKRTEARLPLALAIYAFGGLVQGPLLGALAATWTTGKTPAAVALAVVAAGALFATAEGWPLLDGCYFAVVTSTTLGYGDHAPLGDRGKLAAAALALATVDAAPVVLESVHDALQGHTHRAFGALRDDPGRRPKKRV